MVEWIRSAAEAATGPAGMALRFVTMSPQNQELVEQLVQDHIDAGGERLDLDVRPVPSDFPTDALEGAPTTAAEAGDDAYRLTIRGAGPSLDEQALQALAEAVPDEAAPVPTASTARSSGCCGRSTRCRSNSPRPTFAAAGPSRRRSSRWVSTTRAI